MNRKVRHGVFETNSSSTHSLSLSKSHYLPVVYDLVSIRPDSNNVVTIDLNRFDFGWGTYKCNDALTKAGYVYSDQGDSSKLIDVIKKVTGCSEVIFTGSAPIDHESVGTTSNIQTEDEIEDFVFSLNSWLYITNDNSGPDSIEFWNNDKHFADGSVEKLKLNYVIRIPELCIAYATSMLPSEEEYSYYTDEPTAFSLLKRMLYRNPHKLNGKIYSNIESVDYATRTVTLHHDLEEEAEAIHFDYNEAKGRFNQSLHGKSIYDLKRDLAKNPKYQHKVKYDIECLEEPLDYIADINNIFTYSKNGNADIRIYLEDGTRIIEYDGELELEYPLNVDVRVQSKCSFGMNPETGKAFCSFCHESATTDGAECDYKVLGEHIAELPFNTEIAIGCNELTDNLSEFISEHAYDHIINLTVNMGHLLRDFDKLYQIQDLLGGIGISYRSGFINDTLVFKVNELLNTDKIVLHVIAGIDKFDEILEIGKSDLNIYKLLILGEKDFGFNTGNVDLSSTSHAEWYRRLPELLDVFDVVSFDNLAVEQLDVNRFMSKENYKTFHNGEESVYINAVAGYYAPSSRNNNITSWDDMTVKDYFHSLKK